MAVAAAMELNCPYIYIGKEGTSFCTLAQVNAEEVCRLRNVVKVWQNPLVGFGKPCLIDSGIPTEILASRFLAGDSIAALMADYDITSEQVEIALRYEMARRSDRLNS